MIEYILRGKSQRCDFDFDALYADGGCPVTFLNARLKFDALLNPQVVAT